MPTYSQRVMDNTENEIAELKAELIDTLDSLMRHLCHFDADGTWDTQASSEACQVGERLVQLGEWELVNAGPDRRRWYRPIGPEGR